jgi:hypothetical protein
MPPIRNAIKYLLLLLFIISILHILQENFQVLDKFNLTKTDNFKNPSVSYFDDPNKAKRAIKIDWHNYDDIKDEAKRTGLGEQGKNAVLDKVDETLKKAVYHANGYNGYLSDQISLNRSISDTRHPK